MVQNIPTSILRAFEAAGRNGSFTAAAREMYLTPSAVSHAVRKLEQMLGVALFEREGRRVHLTPDGRALIVHVGKGFEELRRGVEVVSTFAPGLLRLHCAPSFAAQWLGPRLSAFLRQCPGLQIHLGAGTDYLQFQADEYDADIVYGRPAAEGCIVLPLGKETITPMCAPDIAEAIETPADLFDHTLVDCYNKHTRWSTWFATNALSPPPPLGTRFDRSFLAIRAAVDGIGVVLDSTRLAERELASGKLVAPLLGRATDIEYVDHYLVFPLIAKTRRPLRSFVAWLESELGLTSNDF